MSGEPGAAVLDRPPTISVNGAKPASEGVFKRGPLEGPSYGLKERLSGSVDRGAERRKDTGEKFSRFFSGIKEKLVKGMDIAFATPDITAAVGGEVGALTKETALLSKQAVETGWFNFATRIVETRDRWVKSAQDTSDNVRTKIVDTRDATRDKIWEVSEKAYALGVEHVVKPVRDSANDTIRTALEIPTYVEDARAEMKLSRAEAKARKEKLVETRGTERNMALDRWMVEYQKVLDGDNSKAQQARVKALEMKHAAAEKRQMVAMRFAKPRVAAAGLQPA